MKRLTIFLSIFIILCLVGCRDKTKAISVEIDNITMNDEGLVVSFKLDDKSLSKLKISKVGLVYKVYKENEVLTKSSSLGFKEQAFDQEEVEFIISDFLEDTYTKTLQIKVFIETEDEKIKYSEEFKTFCLHDIASSLSTAYALMILSQTEDSYIEEVSLNVDYQNYQIEALDESYEATITTDYNFITIIVNIKETKCLKEGFIFIINNKTIEKGEYTVTDNSITYIKEDPNWTKPY